MTRRDWSPFAVFTAICLQVVVWSQTHRVTPYLGIMPEAPTVRAAEALSLGDSQPYFRLLGMGIQNAGDAFGQFTALKDYDYTALGRWFTLLDALDPQSNYIPALASYYYAQTPKAEDVRPIVDYLAGHAARDPGAKWWWLAQAVYLANHRLNDRQLALELAYELAAAPGNLPIWTRQMPAFILEELGEKEEAMAIIHGILSSAESKNLGEGELNFMHYFIEERLNAIDPALLSKKK